MKIKITLEVDGKVVTEEKELNTEQQKQKPNQLNKLYRILKKEMWNKKE